MKEIERVYFDPCARFMLTPPDLLPNTQRLLCTHIPRAGMFFICSRRRAFDACIVAGLYVHMRA